MPSASSAYYLTVGRIVNDVAISFGLDPVDDPVASTDKQFVQLVRLLEIAAEELASVFPWEALRRDADYTTNDDVNVDGIYALPVDFHYMIPQTHWDATNDRELLGPTSPQGWNYLLWSGTVTPITVVFHQQRGKLYVYPAPNPVGINIRFLYQSTGWVELAQGGSYQSTISESGDYIVLPPALVRSYLLAKYRESKGFSTVGAEEAVSLFLSTSTGQDRTSPILSASQRRRGLHLIGNRNAPDMGYGSQS